MTESPYISGDGLYEIKAGGSASSSFVYFLLPTDLDIPAPTLAEMFNDQDLVGWYVFTTARIDDRESFKAQARASFPSFSPAPDNLLPRGIVWLPNPDRPSEFTDWLVCRKNSPGPYQTRPITVEHLFEWSEFGLLLGTTVNVAFDATNSQLIFSSSDPTSVQILYNRNPQTVGYYNSSVPWNIALPLTGPASGTLEFQAGMDLGSLQTSFRCGLAFFYPSGAGFGALTYPVFTPVAPAQPSSYPGFNVRLDPLLHLDSSRSRLSLDLSGTTRFSQNSLTLKATYFRAINGAAMTLVPQDSVAGGSPPDLDSQAAGFAFCLGPAPATGPTSQAQSVYYLAPMGRFLVETVADNTSGRRQKAELGVEVRWMCGLFGQEFVHISTGDDIEFVPGKPAFAPAFSGQSADGNESDTVLVDTFTTSWVKYPLRGASEGAYFAQPSASVFYAMNANANFPMAVDAFLAAMDGTVVFPVVPYGGIFAPNQAATPSASSVYAAFEAAVLSKTRHRLLAIPGQGPVFRSAPQLALAGVKMSAAKKRRAIKMAGSLSAGATALTPQGLVANLNTAGEWESIVLAKSPDDPTELVQFLGAFPSPPVVAPDLSSALMQNQLFMVAATPANLGQFDSNLSIGGFHAKMNLGLTDTVLVFKYNTSLSLAALAASPALWASPSVFVGNDQAVSAAQQVILDAISVARADAGSPGQPFAYFNRIAQDPAWTGILAFHCAIDGNGMPPDLQMLLGGISGGLRAHHFGIETNHVDRAPNGDLVVGQSSLFGVIHYEGGIAPSTIKDFYYNLDNLTVVFRNSKIVQFAVSVGLTMNALFGRKVELIGGAVESPTIPNTMVIRGQYQSQGDIGTVVFSSDSAFVYKFPVPDGSTRVLDRVEITHASLAPVSAEPLGSPQGGTRMLASFGMGGQLFYAEKPFPNTDGLDLFSYGTDSGGGLEFSSLSLNIEFELNSSGTLASPPTITPQLQTLALAPALGAIRFGSLLSSLPLQLSKFWYSPDGLTPSALGAVPVHCLQLEEQGGISSPMQTGPFPAVAMAPQFALEYDLPLGSLGTLSDVTVGITAKLILAWGPSSLVPDNDAAAVLVQLPEVFAGAGGFSLEGILRTTFGDANLLKVDVDGPVYAILFNNIKFSVLGYSFPPGLLIDFVIFAGKPEKNQPTNGNNIAWFLAAQPAPKAPSQTRLEIAS